MKTRILNFIILAVSILTVFSCAENLETEVTPVGQNRQGDTYTMTIVAGKGEADTKALSLEGRVLNAVWAVNEEVTVYNETKRAPLAGSLKAQSDGPTTTLKGELSGAIDKDDNLTLQFLSPSYNGQDGTLEYISTHCDYSTASVTVTEVNANNISTSTARFVNHQAIVKFTLNEKDGQAIQLDLTKLMVVAGETTLEIVANPSRPDNNVLYVAVPAISGDNLYMKAILDDYGFQVVRAYSKSGVSFQAGQYYEISVKMARTSYVIDYAELKDYVQRYDDDCFNYLILVNDISYWSEYEPIIGGNRVIDLNGHTINGNGKTRLFVVPSGSQLTLVGNGTLTGGDASKSYYSDPGNENGGAIHNAGTLVINGEVTITGNQAVNGGGIYQNGTLEMSGKLVVSENAGGNVYLPEDKVITLGGTFTEGTSIGVTLAEGLGTITSGYSTFHDTADDPAAFFSADDDFFYNVSGKNGEACLTRWYNVATPVTHYANLQALLDETGLLSALGEFAQSLIDINFSNKNASVSAISYTYRSTDPQGLPVTLSALLYVPDAALEGTNALTGMCLTNHGTIASNAQCPTMKAQFEGAFAWKNFAVIMPDYYGFGASAARPQGYLDAENTAHNSIDAYLAAVQLLEDRAVTIPAKLYSFGYSQGGFNSMANLKYVSQHPELSVHFDKVMCGGSPFDVELTWKEYIDGNFNNSLAFVPMTLVSINETKQLNISYSNLFKGSLLTNYEDWILSKQYTTTEISNFISPDSSHPAVIADILHSDLINKRGDAYNAIISIARSYSLTSGWTPPSGTDLLLFHSTNDDTVPFSNLSAMTSFLDSKGVSYNKFDGEYGNHMDAVVWYVLYILNYW
ncbi:MAG: hypothetical protein J6P46_07940 [Bacteroidales bacterium]|nr:hypothetical protein [Bacteroidales bacterium]